MWITTHEPIRSCRLQNSLGSIQPQCWAVQTGSTSAALFGDACWCKTRPLPESMLSRVSTRVVSCSCSEAVLRYFGRWTHSDAHQTCRYLVAARYTTRPRCRNTARRCRRGGLGVVVGLARPCTAPTVQRACQRCSDHWLSESCDGTC